MLGKKIEVTTYDFKGLSLKAAVIDGKLWLRAHEVGTVLGYEHTGMSKNLRHVLDASEVVTIQKMEVNGELRRLFPEGQGSGRLLMVSESGLFKFLLRAQRTRPVAREFQDWVTKTVLPRASPHLIESECGFPK